MFGHLFENRGYDRGMAKKVPDDEPPKVPLFLVYFGLAMLVMVGVVAAVAGILLRR